jgi:hypothetical protein
VARGWESKSVESQIADSGAEAERRGAVPAEERQLRARRRGLELSRARVLEELAATTSRVRRTALESALAQLEAELTKLGG